jgi:hypothetical protein
MIAILRIFLVLQTERRMPMHKVGMIFVMALLCRGLLFSQRERSQPAERDSVERNKATARRVFDDLWTGGRYELVDLMYESNAIVHFATASPR